MGRLVLVDPDHGQPASGQLMAGRAAHRAQPEDDHIALGRHLNPIRPETHGADPRNEAILSVGVGKLTEGVCAR